MSAKQPAKATPEPTPEPSNKPNTAHRKQVADAVLLDGDGNHLHIAVDQGINSEGERHLILINPLTGDRYRAVIALRPVHPLSIMTVPKISVRQGEVPTKKQPFPILGNYPG